MTLVMAALAFLVKLRADLPAHQWPKLFPANGTKGVCASWAPIPEPLASTWHHGSDNSTPARPPRPLSTEHTQIRLPVDRPVYPA
jgi:hypothetical protein